MLFIREYDTKSLDRSSVSMIDKYNTRLNKVDEILDELSSTIDILLSLVRDIRNTLGQCKQRVYNNLDQVKEVVSGNGITGTDSTIDAIESALATGDRAINEAEIQLENIQNAIDCSEEYSDVVGGSGIIECGEACNEAAVEDNSCDHCSFISATVDGNESQCNVCAQGDCVVNMNCDEETDIPREALEEIDDGCPYSITTDSSCNEATSTDLSCNEVYCNHGGDISQAENCNFGCTHPVDCSEPPPSGCTHTCVDGNAGYVGDDCGYVTICGQEDSCNEISCGQYDCGEECGETCHQNTSPEDRGDEDCSEDSCGEDCGDYSDDDYYGGDDCGEACGEDCGDSCGLF